MAKRTIKIDSELYERVAFAVDVLGGDQTLKGYVEEATRQRLHRDRARIEKAARRKQESIGRRLEE